MTTDGYGHPLTLAATTPRAEHLEPTFLGDLCARHIGMPVRLTNGATGTLTDAKHETGGRTWIGLRSPQGWHYYAPHASTETCELLTF